MKWTVNLLLTLRRSLMRILWGVHIPLFKQVRVGNREPPYWGHTAGPGPMGESREGERNEGVGPGEGLLFDHPQEPDALPAAPGSSG